MLETNRDELKKRAAERAVEFVQDGQLLGLGTGSTALFALQALGERVRKGLKITGVATSRHTERIALELGIPLTTLNEVNKLDLAIDGADEIDSNFNMIKGGGGALTREKLVLVAADQRIIIIDEHKMVANLGLGFSVPIEVLPFAWKMTARFLADFDCSPLLRSSQEQIFETDNGNYILDCQFKGIEQVEDTERRIKLLPGVIECGLFVGVCDVAVIGFADRVEVRYRP